MRISDWSSDVCSSDLATGRGAPSGESDRAPRRTRLRHRGGGDADQPPRARLSQPVVGLAVRRIAGDEQSRRGGCSLATRRDRSEEHTSELQSLMRISYAVFCLKKKKQHHKEEKAKQT